MECPICGSDEIEILNSKQKSSKKKLIEEYLLRCEAGKPHFSTKEFRLLSFKSNILDMNLASSAIKI